MKRSLQGAVAILAVLVAVPALAADYPPLRPAYPDDWESSEANPLRYEVGLRYWYSLGGQDVTFPSAFGDTILGVRDTTHIGELYGRIDDLSTQSYVKVYGGLGFASSGTYDLQQPFMPDVNTSLGGAGRVGYVVGDFGWLPFGNMEEGFAIGGLVGYQYWNDSPDIGRGNFAVVDDSSDIAWTPGSPTYSIGGDSERDNLDIHALRLGLSAQVDINDMFDIRAEVAAIPYAWVTGTFGPHEVPNIPFPGGTAYKASATSVSGTGYGASGELMVGVHPTENLTLRIGGRAWYVGGTLDATYTQANITDPIDADADGIYETGPSLSLQDYIFTSQFAQVFRYGALFELTGRF
ncbi:hypothetical protein [Devosia sp. SL43]|uniref:hypothetical protein n=1 Tax=Devosia sp. SL43 TaxID=2806348 RepID=UPI001F29A7F0|nr:hypothetical protein [Devosia sp. SL43]UJW85598.1 hypothetical protein IM737_19765 [Devosia sp. SL43]